MAELEVIYDPAKEVAAIVNVDQRCAWGPAMVGPNAGRILETFIDTVPFVISELSTHDAVAAFTSFLDRVGMASQEATAATDSPSPQPDGHPAVDATAAAAEAEAHNAGDVPAPGPADADMEAHEGATPEVRECPNCQGTGSVTAGDPPISRQCPMCQGAKTVTVNA